MAYNNSLSHYLTVPLVQLCYVSHQLVECNTLQRYDIDELGSSNNVIDIPECDIDSSCMKQKFTCFGLIVVLRSLSAVSLSLCNSSVSLSMLWKSNIFFLAREEIVWKVDTNFSFFRINKSWISSKSGNEWEFQSAHKWVDLNNIDTANVWSCWRYGKLNSCYRM